MRQGLLEDISVPTAEINVGAVATRRQLTLPLEHIYKL